VVVRGAGSEHEARHGGRGIDVPATLAGALATLGALTLLAALAGAVLGGTAYRTGVDDQDLSVAGLVTGLVVLALACLLGGWVAARCAGGRRGGLHGLLAVGWVLVLALVLGALAAVLGNEYDVADRLGLPQWATGAATSLPALLTGLGALVLALLAGWLGGRWGERAVHHRAGGAPVEVVETHRRADAHPGGLGAGRRTGGGWGRR